MCVCLFEVIVFHLVCANVRLSSLSFLLILSPPVLAELQQAGLMTSEECKELFHPSHVIEVQSGKSPEVQTKTAKILERRGFEEESNLLAGKQAQPLIHVLVVCFMVEPSCKGHLKASIIIVFFMHIMLGHSE